MKIQILIDGQSFTGFTEATVSRRFINASGQFTFRTSPQNNIIQGANFNDYPLKTQRQCTILVNNQTFLTGYSESISVMRTASEFNVEIGGRDRTMDLVDSTLDAEVVSEFVAGNKTLKQICERVIEKLGITDVKVIDQANVNTKFAAGDLINYNFGESAFSFLSKYASKQNVLLTTDGLGNLVITNGATDSAIANITPENLLSSSLVLNTGKQFNKYVCYSQIAMSPDFFGTDEKSVAGNNNVGTVENSVIRKGRQYVFVSDTPLLATGAKNRAIWEGNFRQTQGFRYMATLQGFTHDGTNIWQPNQPVTVTDKFVGIDSKMIIESVKYSQSVSGGSVTTLTMVQPDAFQLKIEQDYRESLVYGQADAFK